MARLTPDGRSVVVAVVEGTNTRPDTLDIVDAVSPSSVLRGVYTVGHPTMSVRDLHVAAPNNVPVARAGADQSANAGTTCQATFTFDGSAPSDADEGSIDVWCRRA